MHNFLKPVEDCLQMTMEINTRNKRNELVKQIEALQRFYSDTGFDSENVRTIFALTLGYLREKVDKLVVKSFFEVLMSHDKLKSDKELNLLVCFDQLIDENPNPIPTQIDFTDIKLPEVA